jgi:hypothetical protein
MFFRLQQLSRRISLNLPSFTHTCVVAVQHDTMAQDKEAHIVVPVRRPPWLLAARHQHHQVPAKPRSILDEDDPHAIRGKFAVAGA